MHENEIGTQIVDASMKVHTSLGVGLLESVYESAMMIELTKRGFMVERQVPIDVHYEGQLLGTGFRADLFVNHKVLIELKSVESITPVFRKQTLTYLKLSKLRLGYLMNFNVPRMKDGITRIVNNLDESI